MQDRHFKFKGGAKKGFFSKIGEYEALMVGEKGFFFLFWFELLQLFLSSVPGALGIQLRAIFYKTIFKEFGRGVVVGRNVTIRHPHKISLGSGVVIDDHVLLDAKGTENDGIILGEDVFIGRNSILSCKDGDIMIEARANIGFNCEIFSSSKVRVGEACIVAAYTYVVGGGSYKLDSTSVPMSAFPDFEGKGGIDIGAGVWLGAHVVVLDGVKIANDTALAAGAVVTKDLEPMSVYGGVPAKLISKRDSLSS